MIVPQQGVVIVGRYLLVRPLASGGMGSVWVARHRELEIDVTVKFMAPALVASTDARARFEREAKVAARLNSQHVVQVLDYGVADDTPYIVMELLQGESLWDRLAREGRLPVPATARLAVQICRALRTAHEAALVHRDLKPGNVFLALKDDDEVVKILDFGIAKAAGFGHVDEATKSNVLLGSAHYMSPEQIRSSRDVDHRSDLWSVGVILFRVLTGKLPFPGDVLGDVLVRVCTDPLPPLSAVAPDLPAWLEGFFDRALARAPEQRFQSARELASAFSAGALGAPSLPPSGPSPRWNRTLRMAPEPLPGGHEVTDEGATRRLPEPSRADAPTAMLSHTDTRTLVVTSVSEVKTAGSLRAMLVSDAQVEPAHRIEPLRAHDARAPVRPLWPWVAAIAVAALAGVVGVVLGSRVPRPTLAATEPTAASASPVATETAPGSMVAPKAAAAVSAAPSGSPQAPAPPVQAGQPEAPAQKARGGVGNPREEPARTGLPQAQPAPRGAVDSPATSRRASTPEPTAPPVVRPKSKDNPLDRSD